MLIAAKHMRDLRIDKLMEVYRQSNLEAAQERKNLPPMFALQLAEQDFRQYLQEVFFRTTDAVCYILEEKESYICALRLEPYRDGLLLEALETAPDFRKQGYASLLIREVQKKLAEQGTVRIYSHVNKRNVASLKTHEKCGFRIHSDHAVYISGNVDYRCCTLIYECKHPCI